MCTVHQHAAPKLSHSLQVVLLVAYESLALLVALRQGALGLAYACVMPICSTCSTLLLPVCLLGKQACSFC